MPFKLSDHSKNLGVSQPALEVRARRREVLVEEVAEDGPEPRADRVEGPRQLLFVVSTGWFTDIQCFSVIVATDIVTNGLLIVTIFAQNN